MPKTRCTLLQSLKTKNCIDVTNTRWHFLWTMFSACTSIKVAVLLNKVADLPKEHFSPLDPILYFQLLFLRLLCCCGRDLFILPAGTGTHAPVHMAAAEIAWISFQLDCRRSAASLSASNVSCLSWTYARMWGSDLCFSFPHPPRVGAVLWILLFLPLLSLSYRVSHCSFSGGQVLLPTLSWCTASSFLSEGVFLMNPSGEIFSSTILFSSPFHF